MKPIDKKLELQEIELPNGTTVYVPLGVHFSETIDDWAVNSEDNPFPTRDELLASKIDELKTVLNEFDIPVSDYTSITDLINVLNESIKSNKVTIPIVQDVKVTNPVVIPKDFKINNIPENQKVEDVNLKTELEKMKATQKEILAKLNGEVVSYKGNSTDDKSVIAPNAKRGDEFIELDTKEIYFYTTKWEVF